MAEKGIETEALSKYLGRQLETKTTNGHAYKIDFEPPQCKITFKHVGPWLWIKARAIFEGRTWGEIYDETEHPVSFHAWYDWIGLSDTSPISISHPEELDKWSLFTATFEKKKWEDSECYDNQESTGRYVTDITDDGDVTLEVVTWSGSVEKQNHKIKNYKTEIQHINLVK